MEQLVLLSRSLQGDPARLHPDSPARYASYSKNPLYQSDTSDVVRATLSSGLGNGGLRDSAALHVVEDVGARGSVAARKQEDVLAPFLDSIRANPADPMHSAFSAQMNNLYQVFRELHEQDQQEVRRLLSALDTHKQQVSQLSRENTSMRQHIAQNREQLATANAAAAAAAEAAAQAAAAAASSAAAPPVQQQMEAGGARGGPAGPSVSTQTPPIDLEPGLSLPRQTAMLHNGGLHNGGGAYGMYSRQRSSRMHGAGDSVRGEGWGSVRRGGGGGSGRRSVFILFLPYMLHPASHCWRFYAAWQSSWTTRRTLWLAIVWVFVFLLAVGLLVGLLVPWDQLSSTSFDVEPEVAAVGAAQATFVMALNRNALVYYAVVPAALVSGSTSGRRRLAAAEGAADVPLPSAAAATPHAASAARWAAALRRRLAGAWGLGLAAAGHAHDAAEDVAGGGGSPRRPVQLRSSDWARQEQQGRQRQLQQQRLQLRGRQLAATAKTIKLNNLEPGNLMDLIDAASEDDSPLYPFAVACGVADVRKGSGNYTLTVTSLTALVASAIAAAPAAGNNSLATNTSSNAAAANSSGIAAAVAAADECGASFGLGTRSASVPHWGGPFWGRRCMRCPVLQPSTQYMMLIVGDGGRSTKVLRVPFTTAALPATAAPA